MIKRQEMEDMYISVVENSLTGIYILQNGKIVFANKRFAEIYGYSPQEVIGMDSLDFVHPEDRALVRDMRRKRLEGEEAPAEYEARGLTKKGDKVWIQRRNTVIDYAGKPAILGNILDVSPLKKAQKALKIHATQLEQKNRELEDFAAIASHDLQEPLRKIRVFGDMLVSKCGPFLDQGARDTVERMKQAASRMSKLIDSLLTYSRVSTKAQPLKTVDLNEVVRTAMSNLEIRLGETQGEVSFGDLPVVKADENQMIQLFQNLIGNALKFRQDGIRPRIKIGFKSPGEGSALEKASLYEICVEDNGIGFDQKWGERVFQPFERLHGRSEFEGVGMGLAICRKIVERHGGTIEATGAPESGTSFIFTLPADRPGSPTSA